MINIPVDTYRIQLYVFHKLVPSKYVLNYLDEDGYEISSYTLTTEDPYDVLRFNNTFQDRFRVANFVMSRFSVGCQQVILEFKRG